MKNLKPIARIKSLFNLFSCFQTYRVATGLFVLSILFSFCFIETIMAEPAKKDRYPVYQLIVPKNALLTESDPAGAVKINDHNFLLFMKGRENDKGIFFLSISIPWDLGIEDELSLMVFDCNTIDKNGEMLPAALDNSIYSYMLGNLTQFKSGFGRTRVNRFDERFIYTGFFHVFKETCFGGGHCFYTVQAARPEPSIAAGIYRYI